MESFLRAEIKRTKEQLAEARRQYGDAWRAMKTASMLAGSIRELKEKIENDRSKYSYRGEQGQWRSDVEGADVLFQKQDQEHGKTIGEYTNKRRVMEALMQRNEELHFQLDRLLDGKERWERSHDDFRGRSANEPKHSRHRNRSRTFYDPGSGESFRFTQTWPPPSPPSRSPTPPPRAPTPPPQRPRTPESTTRGPRPFVRPGTLPPQSQIDAFFHAVDLALADPSTVTRFPQPPPFLCAAHADACPKVALGLCACCIESLFTSSSARMEELKTLRLKFHPDKFSRCDEQVRQKVQAEASEVFKIADALWRSVVEREKEEWKRENERRYGPARKW